MSDALDGRIRRLAREEATAALGALTFPEATLEVADGGQAEKRDKEVTELRETVARLDARLAALEKSAGQTDQEPRPTARRGSARRESTE